METDASQRRQALGSREWSLRLKRRTVELLPDADSNLAKLQVGEGAGGVGALEGPGARLEGAELVGWAGGAVGGGTAGVGGLWSLSLVKGRARGRLRSPRRGGASR